MKQFIVGIVLSLLSMMAWSANIDRTNPYTMMTEVADTAFARLKAEMPAIEADPEVLRGIIREEFLPYVNARYAAYKVLGPQLRETSDAERDAFVDAFTEYMVASYAQVLTQYSGQKINIEQAKAIPEGRNIITVRVEILDPSRPVIRLDFAMRKNKRSGEWQGFDMTAEGISLLNTMQTEWGAKIRSDGVTSVAKELRELAAQPIARGNEAQNNG